MFKITSNTIIEHAWLFYFTYLSWIQVLLSWSRAPYHNLGGGCPPSRSSPLSPLTTPFWWICGSLRLPNYSIYRSRGRRLRLNPTTFRKWSLRPLFTYTRTLIPWTCRNFFFSMFDLLSNRKYVCKWYWLMKEHYIVNSTACFEGPITNTSCCSSHFARSRPQNGYICLRQWKG